MKISLTWVAIALTAIAIFFTLVMKIISLDLISFGLSLVAIGLACHAAYELQKIARALPTQYVGRFPAHLRDITKLVSSANESIKILGDSADYGSFGAPELHDRYMAAIIANGKKVHYLIWGEPAAFSSANKMRGDPRFKEFAVSFLKHLGEKCVDIPKAASGRFVKMFQAALAVLKGKTKNWTPEKKYFCKELEVAFNSCKNGKDDRFKATGKFGSIEDASQVRQCLQLPEGLNVFMDDDRVERDALMLCLHEWVVEQFTNANVAIDIYYKAETKPELFFWIIDESEAVFLLSTGREHALAFRSKDRGLVETFMRIFNDKLDEYKRYEESKFKQAIESGNT